MRALILLLLTLALLAPGGPALAFGSCTTPGYLQRFDGRLPESLPSECREVLRVNIETARLRVPMRLITYQATPTLDEAPAMTHLRTLAAKTGAAMHLLGDLDLAQVTILLTDATAPGVAADGRSGMHAWASGWRADDECTIAFFKQPGAITEEYFLISLSHEIFHCVQGKTWREKTGLYPVGTWWIEGTAAYFSHLVVPDTEQLDFLAAAFDASSPTTALVDMAYDASIFFLWFDEKQGGPAGVKRFIDAMPASGGREAQIGALRGLMPLDRFAAFAEDYLDAEIRQPGGRRVPTVARVSPTTTFTGPNSKSSRVEPYVVGRETLLFRQGKSYDLKTTVSDGARVRFQESAGGEWRDPPSEIAACKEDKSYLVAFVTTGDAATAQFAVTDAEALDRRACCLIGEWKPTADAVQGYVRSAQTIGGPAIAGAGGSLSCAYTGGDWTLWFAADGKGGVRWNDFTNRCVTSGPGGSMVNTTTRFGSHEFDWTIVDDRGGRWTATKHDVAWRHVMELGPMRQERILPEDGPATMTGGFAFQCTDTTLDIKGVVGLGHYEYDHTRVGAAPPR